MNPRNFFAELKRRNVYKVAAAYAIVSWLLIQAASIFLPAFDAPSWAIKFLIIAILLGFPIALVLSWAFEITPEGIKLESEIEPNKSIARRTGTKDCCRNDRAGGRRSRSVRVSTRPLEIRYASTERGGYSGPEQVDCRLAVRQSEP